MAKYKSFFILPLNAYKELDEYGWNFKTEGFLEYRMVNLFVVFLNLVETERCNDFLRLSSKNIEFNVSMVSGEVNEIYVKVYNDSCVYDFENYINKIHSLYDFEVFDPNKFFKKY